MNNGETFSDEMLSAAEEAIGYSFSDRALLQLSLTHKSYSNVFGGGDNERLEFLGDAVLELIVTESLYRNTRSDEGKLTELRQQYVSQQALEAACDRAGLKRFMRYSGGKENVGGKTASNLFEAVLGGIYLDGGLNAARAFLARFLAFTEAQNYISRLQEYVQERTRSLPSYSRPVQEDGGFRVQVSALGKRAEGRGKNIRAAEQAAAASLLEKLTERKA